MFVPKRISKMSLTELQTERAELLSLIKKMKRNPAQHSSQLDKMKRRNLQLKDEIFSRRIATEEAPLQIAA